MSHFAWLATGADTMPEEKRRRLSALLEYWQLFRHGGGKSKMTRDEFLRVPWWERLRAIIALAAPPEAIERICYADAPFLRWVPKSSSFGGATR